MTDPEQPNLFPEQPQEPDAIPEALEIREFQDISEEVQRQVYDAVSEEVYALNSFAEALDYLDYNQLEPPKGFSESGEWRKQLIAYMVSIKLNILREQVGNPPPPNEQT